MIITNQRGGRARLASLSLHSFLVSSAKDGLAVQIDVVKKSGLLFLTRPSVKNAPRILSQLSQESTECISTANLRNAGVAVAISRNRYELKDLLPVSPYLSYMRAVVAIYKGF